MTVYSIPPFQTMPLKYDYPFSTITIDNLDIPIEEIMSGSYLPRSPFEETTCTFIWSWLSGTQTFELDTSGSTGTPKRILIRRSQMEASAYATVTALNLQRGDHALVCIDTKYIGGRMMLVRALIAGMKIIGVTPCANPLVNLSSERIDFAAMVPYQVQTILDAPEISLFDRIGKIIIGGAPLLPGTKRELSKLNCLCFATYGMTETISHIALQPLKKNNGTDTYTILPGVTIRSDERECLVIRTSFLDEEIITNDKVKFINSTTFQWLGRLDHVINSGGVKVSPEQVEGKLEGKILRLNLHERFIISSAPHPKLGEQLILVLEKKGLEIEEKNQILNALMGVVDKFEMPKDVFCIFPFPETSSGKIDRTAITKLLTERP